MDEAVGAYEVVAEGCLPMVHMRHDAEVPHTLLQHGNTGDGANAGVRRGAACARGHGLCGLAMCMRHMRIREQPRRTMIQATVPYRLAGSITSEVARAPSPSRAVCVHGGPAPSAAA